MYNFSLFVLLAALQNTQGPEITGVTEKEATEYKINCQNAFARLLLVSLPGADVPDALCTDQFLRTALGREAVKMQIMDARELAYIMSKEKEFKQDLAILQRRYQELKEAPPLEELDYLPSKPYIDGLIALNRRFNVEMCERLPLELDRHEMIVAVIAENNRCYKVLDLLRDSMCPFYYTTVRREAFLKFKTIMKSCGDDDGSYWDTGRLPPATPYWMVEE